MTIKITKVKDIDWRTSAPKFPGISSLTILEPFGKRKPEKYIKIDNEQVKIGIIADVHQNSLILSEILDAFQKLEVNVVLAGGDYSFIPEHLGKEDPKDIRFFQFRKAMELLEKWLSESTRDDSRLVIVMGNHECDPAYFKSGHSSVSFRKIREYTEAMSTNKSIIMPDNPFESYDISNSLHLYVDYQQLNRRSFRLTHAISDSFVTSLYRGLYPASQKSRREAQLKKLKGLIGDVWVKSLEKNFHEAEQLWNTFQASSTANRARIASIITDNIKSAMTTHKQLQYLSKTKNDYSSLAHNYLRQYKNYKKVEDDLTKDFLWNFYNPYDNLDCGVSFEADVFRMNRALGIGHMYSVCGHFHADLGVFQASEEFGTHIIGVAGLQPQKRISGELTAYLIECNENRDTIYRISAIDNSATDFSCDLSKHDWS